MTRSWPLRVLRNGVFLLGSWVVLVAGECRAINPVTELDADHPDLDEGIYLIKDIAALEAEPDAVVVPAVGDEFTVEVRALNDRGRPQPRTEARINVLVDPQFLQFVHACGGNDRFAQFYRDPPAACAGLQPSYHLFDDDGVMWFTFRAVQEGETEITFAYPGRLKVSILGGADGEEPAEGGYTETVSVNVAIGGAPSDDDDDGIPDFDDDCPDTPPDTDVDENGCPLTPPPGADVVVINDINVFDQGAMSEANNVKLVQNLVSFTTAGARDSSSQVIFDRGRNSQCGSDGECGNVALATMRTTIQGEGFTILDQNSSSGSITSIPGSVKTLFLWLPAVAFTNAEINVLKQFASEGGRIVLIGEHAVYYQASGIAVENDFLDKMGAQMTNTGGAVDCGSAFVPASSLRDHQVTTGLTTLKYACSSVIDPGPSDFPLWFDLGGTQLLAGVAAVDITPISTLRVISSLVPLTSKAVPGVKATSTGN